MTCVCRALGCAPARSLHITVGTGHSGAWVWGLLLLDRKTKEGIYACSYRWWIMFGLEVGGDERNLDYFSWCVDSYHGTKVVSLLVDLLYSYLLFILGVRLF